MGKNGRHKIIRPMCIFLFCKSNGVIYWKIGFCLRGRWMYSLPALFRLFISAITSQCRNISILFLMENKSTWTRENIRREISDKTHFKNKFMSLWKLPLKYLWIQNLEETIDDEKIDWKWKKEKSFSSRFSFIFLLLCLLCVVEHRSFSFRSIWGRAEDKWNGDLWKIIDDNGIIYDSALDWTKDGTFIIQGRIVHFFLFSLSLCRVARPQEVLW